MLTLTGTLKQAGNVTYTDKETKKEVHKVKVWLETETPRETGLSDIKIHELFLENIPLETLPKAGEKVSFLVRCYATGKLVNFSVLQVIGKITGSIAQKPILGA